MLLSSSHPCLYGRGWPSFHLVLFYILCLFLTFISLRFVSTVSNSLNLLLFFSIPLPLLPSRPSHTPPIAISVFVISSFLPFFGHLLSLPASHVPFPSSFSPFFNLFILEVSFIPNITLCSMIIPTHTATICKIHQKDS